MFDDIVTEQKLVPRDRVPASYALVHVQTGRVYVGSTGRIYARLYEHQNLLKKGRHPLRELQNDYNASPEMKYYHWLAESPEAAQRGEQELVDRLWDSGKLYNKGRVVLSPNKGKEFSEETRKKMSEIRKGRPASEKLLESLHKTHAAGRTPVEVDSVVYQSTREVGKKFGMTRNSVGYRIRSPAFPTWRYVVEVD